MKIHPLLISQHRQVGCVHNEHAQTKNWPLGYRADQVNQKWSTAANDNSEGPVTQIWSEPLENDTAKTKLTGRVYINFRLAAIFVIDLRAGKQADMVHFIIWLPVGRPYNNIHQQRWLVDVPKGDQASPFSLVIPLTWRCPFRPSADVGIELCNSFRYRFCKVPPQLCDSSSIMLTFLVGVLSSVVWLCWWMGKCPSILQIVTVSFDEQMQEQRKKKQRMGLLNGPNVTVP